MKLKARLFFKVFFIALLFAVGLFITATVFPLMGLLFKASRAKQQRDWLKMLWMKVFGIVMGLKISEQGQRPANLGLLVSNHISWLDIVVLGQLFPAYFAAKSDIQSWPVVGYLAKQAGTIFIRRGDKQQVKETAEVMVWHLKQNSMVIVFPEGTTTTGEEVLPFHASLFQPALLTKTPIQVVALQYSGEAKTQAPFIGDDTFVQHLLRMLALKKIDVRVDFLATINPSGKNRLSISNEAREMILARLLGEQQPIIPTQTAVKRIG